MQGGRVAKGVRADGLSGERRQSGGRHRYVAFEDRPDAEAGDAFAVGVQEQWRVWLVAVCPLTEIATECVRGLLPQRADPLFASLAEDAYLAGCLQAEVFDVQLHHFGSPCAGVVEEGEQGPVAQPEAMPGRRRGQQGLDLVLVQVGHRVRGGLLERDVQDPTAQLCVPGVLVGGVGEEALDRDQPAVPGGRAVFPVGLEVVLEETAEQARNRALRAHGWSPAAGSRASANAWKRVFASCRRAVVMRR